MQMRGNFVNQAGTLEFVKRSDLPFVNGRETAKCDLRAARPP